jgi:hypothetical protein
MEYGVAVHPPWRLSQEMRYRKCRFLRMIWSSKCLPPLNDLKIKDIRNSQVNTRMILLGETAATSRMVIMVEDLRSLAKMESLIKL